MFTLHSLPAKTIRTPSWRRWALAASLLVNLLLPMQATADYGLINETVNITGNQLPPLFSSFTLCTAQGGACGFVAIAAAIMLRFRPILTTVALLVLSITGLRMLIAQEDDAIVKAKGILSGTIAGLILVWLIEPFLRAFYGQQGEIARGQMQQGAAIFTQEVNGLLNWALVIVASLGVMMIILSALKSFGKGEEGIGNIRKTVMSVAGGIFLLIFRTVIGFGFVQNTRSPAIAFIRPIVQIVGYLMGFIALAATVVIIYAGILMILSLGKDEQIQKGKALLGRTVVGLILILISLSLINFVILPGL